MDGCSTLLTRESVWGWEVGMCLGGGGGVRAYAHVLFVCVCVRFDKYENVFQTVRWYSVAVK